MDRGYRKKREIHPKDSAGFFSLATFVYLFKFLRKGRNEALDENDLTETMKSMQSKKLGDELEKCWKKLKVKNPRPSIVRALLHCYGKMLFLLSGLHIVTSVIQIYSVPWAMGRFVSYFEKDQTEISKHEVLFYALVMVTINILDGLWKQHYNLWRAELGIRIQTAISSLLYRKALLLNQSKLNTVTTGNIVTGFTKDVSAINFGIIYGIENFNEIFEILLICYVIYKKVGIASAGGIAILFIALTAQVIFAKLTYKKRKNCNEKSDQRLKQTQEVLSSIRLIKMYVWESFFEKKLLWLRRIELKNLYMVFILKSMARIVGAVSEKIAHLSTLLVYLWLGQRLNADIVYYTTKLFKKVSRAMIYIPLGMQAISEFFVALNRLSKILHADESQISAKKYNEAIKPDITFIQANVKIEKLMILENLNLKLKPGLNILIGPSGCGKTSLLKTILEEYDTTDGKMRVQGSVSYAAQNPWLFPSSLKQNILFGEPLDEVKYRKILGMCGLAYDINTFARGDEVVLTDCGTNLSGGQQARISLARALYRDSDIYLLDDCLASLDIHIKNYVFNSAIKNYLSNKLCLLVTHSTQFVTQADNVIIMDTGTIIYSGKPDDIPSDLLKQKKDQNEINQEIEENNQEVDTTKDDLSDENTTLLTKTQEKNKDSIYKEEKNGGKVNFQVYKDYIQHGGGISMVFVICLFHIGCEALNGLSEKFLSKWLNAQKSMHLNESTSVSTLNEVESSTQPYSSTYSTISTLENSTYSVTDFANQLNLTLQTYEHMDYFNYFVFTTSFASVFAFLGAFVNFYYAIKIAKNIHKSMVKNLLKSCMSYFDSHLIGNILTRFSRDLFYLDEYLPFFWQGLRMVFILGINLTLIVTVSRMFASLAIIMSIVFYLISDYLLSTTRNLQRLNNSTMSPMIGHLNTTLDGLMIIRAHGTEQILKDEFDKYQDLCVTSTHLREISSRVMGFYCHLISALFTSFVTFKLIFTEGVLAGDAGLVLTQATMLGHHIEVCLMLWMFMENSMTSVERILEYTKLQQENNKGQILDNWPMNGEIKFQNVSLTYRTNDETVLKNLNFTIRPKEKIGIVGRTGAGKSSVVVSLFKMYEISGDISIDGINIKTVSLECLRTHLAIIPQYPVIFTGTVRSNIDPYETISDSQVWKFLEVVNLKSHFQSLDDDIAEQNLSIGQKQLISIARALTRKTKIVIIDEATANMDEEMDRFIQGKINDLFEPCTVITVAHRLNTVMNKDRILVMDKGEVVEFDSPRNLLNNTKSLFYRMVHENDGLNSTKNPCESQDKKKN